MKMPSISRAIGFRESVTFQCALSGRIAGLSMVNVLPNHEQQPTGSHRSEVVRNSGLGLLLALLAILGLSHTVQAADFTCTGGDVACLIAAINTANVNGQANAITLAAGRYSLTAADNIIDGVPNGLPSITSDLTITGAGAASTIIDGTRQFRIIYVMATGNLTLQGLTLNGGKARVSPQVGVSTTGNLALPGLTLNGGKVRVSPQVVGGGIYGGGIYNDDGSVKISDSTLSTNTANLGGGIFNNAGNLTITNTTFAGNAYDSEGGGIFNN